MLQEPNYNQNCLLYFAISQSVIKGSKKYSHELEGYRMTSLFMTSRRTQEETGNRKNGLAEFQRTGAISSGSVIQTMLPQCSIQGTPNTQYDTFREANLKGNFAFS